MKSRQLRWALCLTVILGLTFWNPAAGPGAGERPGRETPSRDRNDGPRVEKLGQSTEVRVDFPLGAKPQDVQVSWKVRYVTDRRCGLRITGAWLKRPGESDWLKVVEDLQANNVYVPYGDNSHRYYDMDLRWFPGHGPWKLHDLESGLANLVGPQGKLIDEYTVCEEKDSGLLWLHNGNKWQMENKQDAEQRWGKTYSLRRQEMILWGVYQASNYVYIIQYAFHNDGLIVCRLGSTGKNLTGHLKGNHMHNTLWRVQLDLGGSGPEDTQKRLAQENRVTIGKLKEIRAEQGKANIHYEPVTQEKGLEWEPKEFTFLRFTNPQVKNKVGNQVSYEMVPHRHGTARHFSPPWDLKLATGKLQFPSDGFSENDFYVTNHDPQFKDYRELPSYVKDGKPLGGNPVLWHISSNLHIPRDEDLIGTEDRRLPGCATVMFSGFELRPRSVFNETPFLRLPNSK